MHVPGETVFIAAFLCFPVELPRSIRDVSVPGHPSDTLYDVYKSMAASRFTAMLNSIVILKPKSIRFD